LYGHVSNLPGVIFLFIKDFRGHIVTRSHILKLSSNLEDKEQFLVES
jgi:hypothetical protein